MTDNWQRLGTIETDAHRRLSNVQADLEWLTIEEKAIMFGEFKGYAEEKGYKPTWAVAKYKDRFGEWPTANVKATAPIPCSPATRMWIDATVREFWRMKKRRG